MCLVKDRTYNILYSNNKLFTTPLDCLKHFLDIIKTVFVSKYYPMLDLDKKKIGT